METEVETLGLSSWDKREESITESGGGGEDCLARLKNSRAPWEPSRAPTVHLQSKGQAFRDLLTNLLLNF